MKAIILAAGRGSRMNEMTELHPKGLTHLAGRSLLSYQVKALQLAGIKNIGIVTGYRSECFEHYSFTKFHNKIWQETNMVSSLMCAENWLKNEECIISYSDIFYGSEVIKNLSENKDEIAISYDPKWKELWQKRFVNPLDDCETFLCDGDNYLLEIGNKPEAIDDVQGQYMGLLKITPKGFCEIQRALSGMPEQFVQKLDMTGMLKILLKRGTRIKCLANKEDWGEVDSQLDLYLYEELHRQKKIKLIS